MTTEQIEQWVQRVEQRVIALENKPINKSEAGLEEMAELKSAISKNKTTIERLDLILTHHQQEIEILMQEIEILNNFSQRRLKETKKPKSWWSKLWLK